MKSTIETREMAQKVVDYIGDNPERHSQSWFCSGWEDEGMCDTTMCIAGTAVFLEGGSEALVEGRQNGVKWWTDNGARILGLNKNEALNLFYCMDNEAAVAATVAIAQGDEVKFNAVLREVFEREGEEYVDD
jgi:hypothetical protein